MHAFFSDPHLGLPRQSNMTPGSAASLRDALYEKTHLITVEGGTNICCGDVFDTYSNQESVVAQGHRIVSSCLVVLSGNHDLTNRESGYGSLQLIDHVLGEDSPCVFAKFGHPHAQVHPIIYDNLRLISVPHVASQDLFEQSLGLALDLAERGVGRQVRTALLLHCNHDLPEDRLTTTTLNLTSEHVEELLGGFDFILMGHEHQPDELYGGRLIKLGNVHPTGFADISDKRILLWDGAEFRSHKVWSKAEGYAEFTPATLPRSTRANFARVKGTATVDSMLGVSKEIMAMWERSPSLYGVKVEVEVEGMTVPDREGIVVAMMRLPDLIRKDLESNPDILSLWDSLLLKVASDD